MSLFVADGLVKRLVKPAGDRSCQPDGGGGRDPRPDRPQWRGQIHPDLISGLLPADAGRVLLDGTDLSTLAPHQRARRPWRCFQITSVFRNDSVRDNLLLAVQAQAGSSFAVCADVTANAS